MTESGYARIVKEWKRGTPLESATLVYEGKATDMAIGAGHDDTPGYERDFVYRALAFYNNELYLRQGRQADQGRRAQLGAEVGAARMAGAGAARRGGRRSKDLQGRHVQRYPPRPLKVARAPPH